MGFNPHPARRPDATDDDEDAVEALTEFQSSSGQKAGCNMPARLDPQLITCFNPHPARRPDATPIGEGVKGLVKAMFQSSSGQKAGCNLN